MLLDAKLKNGLLGAAAMGAVVFGLGGVAPASATTIQSFLFNNTLWNDLSVEGQNVDLNGNKLLDVGDTLRGILTINNVTDQPPGSGTTTNVAATGTEITAIFEAQIATKTLVSATGGPGGTPLYNFTFTPNAAFGTSVGVVGAMAAFYFDTSPDFQISGATCTSAAPGGSCESHATDGALKLVLGESADTDFLWQALGATDNTALLQNVSTTTSVGTFNANLFVLLNNTGFGFNQIPSEIPGYVTPVGADGLIDVAVDGTVRGKCAAFSAPGVCSTAATVYQAEDKSDFHFRAVPEPTTIAIIGMGLLGMGAFSRRRKKSA